MKWNRLSIIIYLQILTILFLSLSILFSKKAGLKISVSPINSRNTMQHLSKKLKFYYEPLPNTKETITNKWEPKTATYTINRDSLNELKDYQVNKGKNIFRIITLGDSFTFGDGVSTKENWTELLERKLNSNFSCGNKIKYEVINFGVRGYDTEYEVERYRRRGQKYNPDLVIWTFGDLKRFKELMYPLAINLKKMDPSYIVRMEKEFYGDEVAVDALDERTILAVANGIISRTLSIEEIIHKQNSLIDKFDSLYSSTLLYIDINDSDNNLVKSLFGHRTGKQKYFDKYTFKPIDRLPDYHFSLIGHKNMMDRILGTLTKYKIINCRK